MKSSTTRAFRFVFLAVGLVLSTALAAFAQSGSLGITGTTSLFGANPAGPVGVDGTGIRPTAITLNVGTGRVLTLSSVTGLVGADASGTTIGPDGGFFASANTNILSYNGISGIIDDNNRQMALYGLFTDGSFSGTGLAPALPQTNYSEIGGLGHNFSSFSPTLNQAFYIGDGRTAANVLQQFLAPDSAATLYLGFVDAFAFQGTPGFYGDNTGQFQVRYDITGAGTGAAAPEPGSLALLLPIAGTLGMAAARRVRNQTA